MQGAGEDPDGDPPSLCMRRGTSTASESTERMIAMNRRAKVIEGGEIATVEIVRSSACEACHKNGAGCSACDILTMNRTVTAKAKNLIGAKPGDMVVIETPSGRVLGYAALVFLFPLVTALAFYFAAGLISGPTALPYLLSLAGFVLAFVVLYLVAGRLTKNRYDIVIVGFAQGLSDAGADE